MTYSSTLELSQNEPVIKENKDGKKNLKCKSFLTLGVTFIVASLTVGGATFSYLKQNELLDNSFSKTIDNISYQYTKNTIFSSIQSYREHILNNSIENNPLSFHRKIDNNKIYETKAGKEHREKIITQLKNQGIFLDKAKFEAIYQPLLIAIKNQNDFNNKKIDFVQMNQANKNIKDIRETFIFEENKNKVSLKK